MHSPHRLLWFRRLCLLGACLAGLVVVLGAWVRLTDAGLGCPDWPGCYGHFHPVAAHDGSAFDSAKAWHEMIHRYFATSLGLTIVAAFALSLWNRKDPAQPVRAVALLFMVVCLQGALGALTVSWLLKPLIVTAHLLGGLTTLGLLWWLSLPPPRVSAGDQARLRGFATVALAVLALQITLGGWTSSNYAAVACPDFPTCQGRWFPQADFRDAFALASGPGVDYEGGVLPQPARMAVHLAHRLGALVTAATMAALAFWILCGAYRGWLRFCAQLLLVALAVQIALGIAMVRDGVPLLLATAHNAGAAGLVIAMVTLLHAVWAPAASMAQTVAQRHGWRDFLELTKPKVSLLIVFTAIVGMILASPGMVPWKALLFGTLGIGMASGSAAAFNHILDRRIDEQMARTRHRPLPAGHLRQRDAVLFASVLGGASMLVLWFGVNRLTAALTFFSLIGYAVIYTQWLKRATPQNIVIGGAAGAAPPILGWAAVTNSIDAHALLLFLIVFTWTPPHFWALAIARREDYAKVGIPMLPVTHGVAYTQHQILLYTILLVLVTLMPYLTGMSGFIYLGCVLLLNGRFLYYVLVQKHSARPERPMQTFKFSVNYLMLLFAALILDHYFLFKV